VAPVRAALVTPLSGPMGGFGRAGAAALALWADRFSGPDQVRLTVVDAHPDARGALHRAEGTRPDLLFGPYGSGPAARAAAAASRLVWNHGGAQVPPRRNVINVLAPARTYFTGAVQLLHHHLAGGFSAGVLHSDTGFGRGVGGGALAEAQRLGIETRRAVLPESTPEADVLLVVASPAQEVRIAETLDFRGRKAVGFVAAGVREVLSGLGERREGLLGPAQWLAEAAPIPDEGPSAEEFLAAFRERTGQEPAYPAVQAFAAGLLALRCLRAAGASRDAAVLEAARRLDCTTLFGRFRIDTRGQQVGHRVLTVQWRGGRRVVVWPPESAGARWQPLPVA